MPELLFAGCATHSTAGRTAPTSKDDGVKERLVCTFSRLLPGVNVTTIITGPLACHSFCVTSDGRTLAWGRNEDGQLGLGDDINRYVPTQVPNLAGLVKGGCCGGSHSMLYTVEGGLYGAGKNNCGQLGNGKISAEPFVKFTQTKGELNTHKVIGVSAGRDFTLVCTDAGDVYSFGSPEYGQLGNGTDGKTLEKAGKWTFAYRPTPGKVDHLKKFGQEGAKIVAVSCGTNHSCVQDEDGRLYTWGFGGYGRLGHGDIKDKMTPEPVALFCAIPPPPNPAIPAFAQRSVLKVRASKICCGSSSTFAVTSTPYQALYFWGITKKAGEAQLKPIIVDDLQGHQISCVSTGNTSTIVATARMLVTWGPSPTYGELGYGEDNARSSTKAKEVDSLAGALVVQVAAGYAHNLVLVDVSDEESKKIVENSLIEKLDELAAGSGGAAAKKKAASAATATGGGGKKKKGKKDEEEEEGEEEEEVEEEDDEDADEDDLPAKKKKKRG